MSGSQHGNSPTSTKEMKAVSSASSNDEKSKSASVKDKMITVGRRTVPSEKLDRLYQLKKQAFLDLLKDVVPYLKQVAPRPLVNPSCFISYAWGDPYYEY